MVFASYDVKKCPVAARLLAVVTSDQSMRLAHWDTLVGKSLIYWTLISRFFGLFVTSKAVALQLLNISKNGTEYVSVAIRGFNRFEFNGTALMSLWFCWWRYRKYFPTLRLQVLWDAIKVWHLPNRQRDGVKTCRSLQVKDKQTGQLANLLFKVNQ